MVITMVLQKVLSHLGLSSFTKGIFNLPHSTSSVFSIASALIGFVQIVFEFTETLKLEVNAVIYIGHFTLHHLM